MAKHTHQQHLLISQEEIKAIDDFMFANRIRSRAEAMRSLITYALEQKAEQVKTVEALHMAGATIAALVNEHGIDPAERIALVRGVNGSRERTVAEALCLVEEALERGGAV